MPSNWCKLVMSIAPLAREDLLERAADPRPLRADERGVDTPVDLLAEEVRRAVAHHDVDAPGVERRRPGGLPLGLIDRGVDRLVGERQLTPIVCTPIIDAAGRAAGVLA